MCARWEAEGRDGEEARMGKKRRGSLGDNEAGCGYLGTYGQASKVLCTVKTREREQLYHSVFNSLPHETIKSGVISVF